MKSVLKKQIKKSVLLKKTYIGFHKLKRYYKLRVLYVIPMLYRYFGFSEDSYKRMVRYKKKHINERCFIIATGPSLTMDDLSKLKDEITIGMNSLCMIFPKLGWETTYFGIQDRDVYGKVEKYISNTAQTDVFLGDYIDSPKIINEKFCRFSLDMTYRDHPYKKDLTKFSKNCYKRVYNGGTITYSLIQIAVYMGFKEIYLLGVDNHYSDDKNKQHFVEHGHFDPNYKTAGERNAIAYQAAKKFADSHNIKIFNATRGGMLEVFPRVDLDEVLQLKNLKSVQ